MKIYQNLALVTLGASLTFTVVEVKPAAAIQINFTVDIQQLGQYEGSFSYTPPPSGTKLVPFDSFSFNFIDLSSGNTNTPKSYSLADLVPLPASGVVVQPAEFGIITSAFYQRGIEEFELTYVGFGDLMYSPPFGDFTFQGSLGGVPVSGGSGRVYFAVPEPSMVPATALATLSLGSLLLKKKIATSQRN